MGITANRRTLTTAVARVRTNRRRIKFAAVPFALLLIPRAGPSGVFYALRPAEADAPPPGRLRCYHFQ